MLANKLLPYFFYPMTWLVVLLLLTVGLLRRERWRAAQRTLAAAVLLLLVASSPMVADFLQRSLERQYPMRALEQLPPAGAIVLLGGGVQLPAPPRLMPDLNDAADRLWFAAELYHAGKAPLIVVSGGQVFPQPGLLSEAEYHVQLLQRLGVPRDAILLETRSPNTAANAVYTAELLRKRSINDILLVTSASHMPRAMLLFNETGLNVEPATCDIQVAALNEPLILDLLPSEYALSNTQSALREWGGLGFYHLRALLR